MHIQISELTGQVRTNCDISDAQYAGLYSICGLALRLRDLYKWQHRLPPWEEKHSDEILDWIGRKETHWETLGDREFTPIEINGRAFDPFDTRAINTILTPSSLFYGAGYARGLKPTFFLATLDTVKTEHGHPVNILGHELARDLLTLPALTQDGQVVLRRDAAGFYFWDQMFYITKSARPALEIALTHSGVTGRNPTTLQQNLFKLLAIQQPTYIRHEIGELNDTTFAPEIWQEIIAAFPHTAAELITRTVKDILADTHPDGPLHHISHNRDVARLAFYVAFQQGLAKTVFPQIRDAFDALIKTDDWQIIDQTVASGYARARDWAQTISRIYMEGKQKQNLAAAQKQIEDYLLPPKKGTA